MKHPMQEAAQKMRNHWYSCQLKWSTPYIHCSPGYSHPKCEEGQKLQREYMELINEWIKKEKEEKLLSQLP